MKTTKNRRLKSMYVNSGRVHSLGHMLAAAAGGVGCNPLEPDDRNLFEQIDQSVHHCVAGQAAHVECPREQVSTETSWATRF